jgi:hypothetical protein
MSRPFKVPTLIAAFLILFTSTHQASACSCVEFSPCQAFGYSSAIFVGRMLGGTEKVRDYTENGKALSVESGQARFAVEESFKGVKGTEINIFILNLKGTSCGGYGLVKGERYLVYAHDTDSVGLSVGPCSPTKHLKYAKVDLEFLHHLPQNGVGGRLFGHVGVDLGGSNNPSLPGATITVTDGQQAYQATTDSKGDYEITGMKPGNYRVEIKLPKNYVADHTTREVIISDRGCAQASFWPKTSTTLRGRVVDSAGRAAPANLELISIDEEDRKFLGFADYDGEYEIDGLAAGRYLLYVEIVSAGKDSRSDNEEPYYYPGVTERDKAKVIEIQMGETLAGYDFTLPRKLTVQVIQGVVTYPDGIPVANGDVIVSVKDTTTASIYRTDNNPPNTSTDELGGFTIQGFKGNTYEIWARENVSIAIEKKRQQMRSEPIKLLLNKDVNNIKIVLSVPKPAEKSKE